MPPPHRASLPTWVQKSLLGVPAAVAVESVIMVETEPRRMAVWYRVLDVPGDNVLALGQGPWTPYSTPNDMTNQAAAQLAWVLEEVLQPF